MKQLFGVVACVVWIPVAGCGSGAESESEGEGAASCGPSSQSCVVCGASACDTPNVCCGVGGTPACTAEGACGESFQAACEGSEDCDGANCCFLMHLEEFGSSVIGDGKSFCSDRFCTLSCVGDGCNTGACQASSDCNEYSDLDGAGSCCKLPGFDVGACVRDDWAGLIEDNGGACN